MRRKIIMPMAAFAALMLVAGSGFAGNTTIGTLTTDDDDFVTDEQCREAWAASPAYNECGSRSSASGSGQTESVDALANTCVIATSCEYYVTKQKESDSTGDITEVVTSVTLARRDTTWQGGLENTREVENCNGSLWFKC